ncbi:transcription termination factor Rho [Pseudobutyrivibrio sp. YE44]|uniref:transcription termination factor Rho n=1 Tax=Pseudobutyrivibrio sp. YE44 TaxID=1520802 RepID=UPI000890DF4E|nr:transcription termination factor Rho [Pseudobutyrivibrio sp. YE44]SDB20690.1 transcription termination factor Rho [Pseudobutyrivibrio sp. YE44]
MREKYESLAVTVLRDLAKARGIKGVSSMKKADLVEAMLAQDEIDAKEAAAKDPAVSEAPAKEVKEAKESAPRAERPRRIERVERPERAERAERVERVERPERAERMEKTERVERNDGLPQDIPMDGLLSASGILEVMSDGFGFIRCDNYMPGTEDVYVSQSQIKKFNLKTGDIIIGKKRFNNPTDKFAALMIIDTINGYDPAAATRRPNFEDLTPIFPNERIRLERQRSSVAMRIVDLVSPIGKGQRGMIVAQPKAGKTTLLKEVATSVNYSHPDMHLIILLIDERPEEVTDMKDTMRNSKNVEVIYSTFDESPEHHRRVSEMVIERAKRLVEHGQDVMILLDSITRLARAYNLTVQPSGRTLSGGLDPAALHMPKKFFGAARNMREGGSLTILATALVETGSKMDDVVYEEFKGTGNMELILDRKLSEKRIFPAIDITASGTRREDLLLSRKELDAMEIMRKAINSARKEDAIETILNMFAHTKCNDDYIDMVIRKRVI